jgi:hypothetical protein
VYTTGAASTFAHLRALREGFAKPDSVADPRYALLQFMAAATPRDAVVAGILGLILKNRIQIREK